MEIGGGGLEMGERSLCWDPAQLHSGDARQHLRDPVSDMGIDGGDGDQTGGI